MARGGHSYDVPRALRGQVRALFHHGATTQPVRVPFVPLGRTTRPSTCGTRGTTVLHDADGAALRRKRKSWMAARSTPEALARFGQAQAMRRRWRRMMVSASALSRSAPPQIENPQISAAGDRRVLEPPA